MNGEVSAKLKDKIEVRTFSSISPNQCRKHEDVLSNNTGWVCTKCTLKNADAVRRCSACQFPRHSDFSSSSSEHRNWKPSRVPVRQCSEITEDLRHIEESEANERMVDVLQMCRRNRTSFVDETFPPCETSIGALSMTERSKHPLIKWCRPFEINAVVDNFPIDILSHWTVFCQDPKSLDIVQGILGNCWFLSALAVVAERTDILEHIVITRGVCVEGFYQIRLCVEGRWRIISVDDRFPCDTYNRLIYSHAKRRQLWVPLIEKALAKVHGSYASLSAGRTLEGLAVLTGAPCISVSLEGEDENDEANFDAHLVWATLLSCKEADFLMGASCGAGRRLIDDEEASRLGLHNRHAYSVLDVRDVEGLRLVQLRNPWGRGAWTGEWSQTSELWNPELRRLLQPDGPKEGVFWMPFEQFCKYFDSVDVCKVKPSCREIRIPGFLPPHCLPNYVTATYVTVNETTEIDFTLYQSGIRNVVNTVHGILDLCILIFECNIYGVAGKLVAHSGRWVKPFVVASCVLKSGTYVCFCLAFAHFGLTLPDEDVPRSTLSLHSINSLTTQTSIVDPACVADALIGFLLIEGDQRNRLAQISMYYSPKRWAGLMIMVENKSFEYCAVVKCVCTDSVNVVSSRGALETSDIVPPRHRQIIIILTQVEPTASYLVKHSLWVGQSLEGRLGQYAPTVDGCSPGAAHWPEVDERVGGVHVCRSFST